MHSLHLESDGPKHLSFDGDVQPSTGVQAKKGLVVTFPSSFASSFAFHLLCALHTEASQKKIKETVGTTLGIERICAGNKKRTQDAKPKNASYDISSILLEVKGD